MYFSCNIVLVYVYVIQQVCVCDLLSAILFFCVFVMWTMWIVVLDLILCHLGCVGERKWVRAKERNEISKSYPFLHMRSHPHTQINIRQSLSLSLSSPNSLTHTFISLSPIIHLWQSHQLLHPKVTSHTQYVHSMLPSVMKSKIKRIYKFHQILNTYTLRNQSQSHIKISQWICETPIFQSRLSLFLSKISVELEWNWIYPLKKFLILEKVIDKTRHIKCACACVCECKYLFHLLTQTQCLQWKW